MFRSVRFMPAARIIVWMPLLATPAVRAMAQEALRETVIVTAGAHPVPFQSISRTVTVLTREDIARLPIESVADLMRYAASVSLNTRGPFGVQSNFSVRGASFGQTLVLINGVRINNAQTGHHNSDLPVVLADIDRVEVLYGPGSSLYGADAFGGTINIITRPSGARAEGQAIAGSYGLIDATATAGFASGRLRQSLSVAGNRSTGFTHARDFETLTLSSRSDLGQDSTFYLSHQLKEFGAHGFYGPSPSREWTNSTLAAFERRFPQTVADRIGGGAYYRTHGDRFLWDQGRPGIFENTHRTHALGIHGKAQWLPGTTTRFTLGAEAGGDWIVSSNLGRRSFGRGSIYSELQHQRGNAALAVGLRLDHYTHFGSAPSPSLGGSWWIRPNLRLRSSAGRAFRIPTFTELFYRDPIHEALSTLKPEKSWGAEAGADWWPHASWMARLTLFRRWDADVIDWARETLADKWQTRNLRDLDTQGVEVALQRRLAEHWALQVEYAYLRLRTATPAGYSKYVMDYPRHSFVAFGDCRLPLALALGPRVSHKTRADGRRYWLVDARLSRPIGRYVLFLDASNLLDSRYEEIRGVEMPGRWLRVGLKITGF